MAVLVKRLSSSGVSLLPLLHSCLALSKLSSTKAFPSPQPKPTGVCGEGGRVSKYDPHSYITITPRLLWSEKRSPLHTHLHTPRTTSATQWVYCRAFFPESTALLST
ncbi:unnamed protein product [Lota lota]